jgi:deoxyhypusine synthase
MEKVRGMQLSKDMKIADLAKGMANIGFQATQLSRAVKVIEKMKKDKAVIFFSFTSNMVSSGLREIIAQLLRERFVDVVVTSVGSIEEDLIKTGKPFLLGSFDADDTVLRKQGVNRIGNIFVPDDRYEFLEDKLAPFFKKLYERQQKKKRLISPSELIFELGKEINDKNSIIYWAAKNNIPVFCPAITDGAFGLQLYFFKQKFREFGIDVTGDMEQLAKIVLEADKTGAIILGGGVAKHHTIGVNILRGGLDYAVYISTGTEYDGSLSGARPREAVSWSKISKDGNYVFVNGDATIIFPIVAGALCK